MQKQGRLCEKLHILTGWQKEKIMDDKELTELARQAGFSAAVISADRVPVDGKFRAFCEENRCGQYNANYACPPDCGSVEEMFRKIRSAEKALVLMTQWPIDGYQDTAAIRNGKRSHNRAMLRLNAELGKRNDAGRCAGGSCCDLCDPCERRSGRPCPHPDLRFSCMSAYCVNVAELAEKCGLEFAWDRKKLYVFSMILLGMKREK